MNRWDRKLTDAVAIDETVILLHPALPLLGATTWVERGCQSNEDGFSPEHDRPPLPECREGRVARVRLLPICGQPSSCAVSRGCSGALSKAEESGMQPRDDTRREVHKLPLVIGDGS